MDRFVRWNVMAILLFPVVSPAVAAEPGGHFGIGIGVTDGAGNSHGPWSLGNGESGLYGQGGCLDLSWQTARDGVFQARPRLTWFSMGTGRTLQDSNTPIQAKVHGRSATCDLMFRYFRDSPCSFYFFVGPGLSSYATRVIPLEMNSQQSNWVLQADVGIGVSLAQHGDLELRYSNVVHPLFPLFTGFAWGSSLDYSPNFISLVIRVRI